MLEILRDNGLYLLIGQFPQGPLGGLALTLVLAAVSLAAALPLGIVLAVGRLAKTSIIRWSVTALIWIVRGTPLLMMIFWAYFLVPLLVGKRIPGVLTLVVALVIFTAAYVAEIIRAGVEALPRGQWEAAASLGLTRRQALARVVLPQALRNMLPSLVNQFVSLTKDTSLAFIVGISELTYVASKVNDRTLSHPAEIFFIVAVAYFVICFALTSYARRLERQLAWGGRA